MRSATVERRAPKREAEHSASAPSACVLNLWEQGIDRYETCAAALGRLLIAQPTRVHTFADSAIVESALRAAMNKDLARTRASKSAFWVSAVAQFLEFKGRSSEAAAVYRQALDSLKAAHGPDHPKTKIVAEELARFLHRLGKKDEASLVRHELQVEHLLTRSDPGSLLALREVAYGAFSSGCFVQAEVCYRHLLAHNFEPPGTHCHLARVLIALGRDADAAAEVGRAWECRPEDEPYIILRILFFKALLATLAARDAQAPLTMLKQLLRDHPTATHPWRIAPVLERIRPRLTPPSHAFFTQLSQAITGNSAE